MIAKHGTRRVSCLSLSDTAPSGIAYLGEHGSCQRDVGRMSLIRGDTDVTCPQCRVVARKIRGVFSLSQHATRPRRIEISLNTRRPSRADPSTWHDTARLQTTLHFSDGRSYVCQRYVYSVSQRYVRHNGAIAVCLPKRCIRPSAVSTIILVGLYGS
jgi:hypothetical protein